MKFTDKLEGDIVVFDISGKIEGGEQTTLFHGKIHEFIQAGKRKFILNLERTEWMDSVGLGLLISALTTVKNAEGDVGRLVFANITSIKSILDATGLIKIFEHYESVALAKASF